MARLQPKPASYVHRIVIGASSRPDDPAKGEKREIEIRDSSQCSLLDLMDKILALVQLGRGGVEELAWPPADAEALAFVLVSVVPSYDNT